MPTAGGEPTSHQQPPSLVLPCEVGHYRIEQQLGRGGMGIVYRGLDLRLQRTVAFKTLHGLPNAGQLERIEREARLLAALDHPAVAAIHDIIDLEGSPLLVLELVEGQSLAARLEHGPLPPAEAVAVCARVASALEAAHAREIVHRDLKPGNVRFDAKGAVKVLDFGIARLAKRPGGGSREGTPGYMSPEQILGEPPDPSTDVWALGCLLYECLCGVPAFLRETPEASLRATLETRPDLGRLPPETPEELRQLLRSCLRRKPKRRLAHVAELRRGLEHVLQQLETQWDARVPTSPTRLRRQVGLGPLVGREHELDELSRLLPRARLLTLVGGAGCGKSRLALELARRHVRSGSGRLVHVEIGSLTPADALAHHLLQAAGCSDQPTTTAEDQLVHQLSEPTLLLLDNCERLRLPCAELATRLLAACSRLRVLATSREPLRLELEQTYPVAPLASPDGESGDPELLRHSPAVELFVLRARQVRYGFELEARNARTVARLCRRLDGIPLALELAAARLRSLSLDELARRLETGLDLLEDARSLRPPHHRSLRAAIEWSHRSLSPEERQLFRRLGCFADGFSLQLAEAVCEAPEFPATRVTELLSHLVELSLVQLDAPGERYRMLAPLREFACEQLREHGELEQQQLRLCLALCELAEELMQRQPAPGRRGGAGALAPEHVNLMAALDDPTPGREAALARLRLATTLGPYWIRHGHWRGGRLRLERALADAQAAPSRLRAGAHAVLGHLAQRLGEPLAARRRHRRAAQLYRRGGQCQELSEQLIQLGRLALHADKLSAARQQYTDALRHARQARAAGTAALALAELARVALRSGSLVRARSYLEQARHRYSELADGPGLALVHTRLAELLASEGKTRHAQRQLEQALRLLRSLGHWSGVARCLVELGRSSGAHGELAVAHHQLELARRLGERIDSVEVVAHAHVQAGALARIAGQPGEARGHHLLSLQRFEELGKLSGTARSATELARDWLMCGKPERALQPARRALEIYSRLERCQGEALARLVLADVERLSGDPRHGLELSELALGTLRRESQPETYAEALCVRALCCVELGDTGAALASLQQSLPLAEPAGRLPLRSLVFQTGAHVALSLGRSEQAAMLIGAAQAASHGGSLRPAWPAEWTRRRELLERQLGAAFMDAFSLGRKQPAHVALEQLERLCDEAEQVPGTGLRAPDANE